MAMRRTSGKTLLIIAGVSVVAVVAYDHAKAKGLIPSPKGK